MGRYVVPGLLVLLSWLLVRSQASAQSTTSTAAVVTQPTVDNNMIIGFLHPSVAQDGKVINNCVYPAADCAEWNAEMCAANYVGLPIQMSFQRGTAATSPANVKAYYWVQPNNNTCSANPLNGNSVWPNPASATVTGLPVTSSFVGSTQAVTVPNDFAPLPGGQTLDTRTIMQSGFPGTCDGAGVSYTRWRLCLGIDTDNDGYINPPSGNSTDVTGYFEFLVDTVLPSSPNIISTESLYKRVDINVSYDTGFESLYGLVVRASNDPADVASGDCNSWVGHVDEQVVQVGYGGTGSGQLTITVPGTDGTQYAYCAAVIDVVGNRSAYAGPAVDEPHTECDLFDCYPPDAGFITGFGSCTTGLTSGWWAAMTSLWLTVRWRRRRTLWNAGSTSRE